MEGKIRTRSYDDQGGIKRYVTEIFVDTMEMLTPKTASPGAGPVCAASRSDRPAATTGTTAGCPCTR